MCDECKRLRMINKILVRALQRAKAKTPLPVSGGSPDDPMAFPVPMGREEGIEAWRATWESYRQQRDGGR
jgi:predicted RNA polymerase sigma factor